MIVEDTRRQLLQKSRNAGYYKEPSFGRTRYERAGRSKISSSTKTYNQIDMNRLFKQDELEVGIPVIGETDNYEVTVIISGVIAELAKNIKNNRNVLEFKCVMQALTKAFDANQIRVKCTCDDFRYRFAHFMILDGTSADDTSKDPGAGKGGLKDENGRGCKHILLVLENMDWLMKVASVLKNYIFYAEKSFSKAFQDIIFPKLYGTDVESAKGSLLPKDFNLQADKGVIEAINDKAHATGAEAAAQAQ